VEKDDYLADRAARVCVVQHGGMRNCSADVLRSKVSAIEGLAELTKHRARDSQIGPWRSVVARVDGRERSENMGIIQRIRRRLDGKYKES
jgi:hypothetical protein